jgi:hypothetical protein
MLNGEMLTDYAAEFFSYCTKGRLEQIIKAGKTNDVVLQ